MKRHLQKVLAVAVALAMVVTMVPAQSAQAASKKPKLNVTKKTLLVGSKTTLKVKNKVAGSTYTWKSSNTAAATVTKKGVVTAKAAGASVISCKVKTPSKSYTLKATIKVKSAVTVKTQKELDKALANKGVTQIKIKTSAKTSFTIGSGDYSKKLLIVEAPNADITNNGTFKRIAIRSIKANTWFEKAKGNKFSVSAPESRIVVEESASVSKIAFTGKAGKSAVEVKGKVAQVAIQASVEVSLSGAAAESVEVKVASNAANAKLIASIPVKVITVTTISVELKVGAEGSTITITETSVKVTIKNGTTANVTVTEANGAQSTVNSGSESSVGGTTDSSTGGSTSGGSSSGGSSGGSSTSKSSAKAITSFKINDVEGTIDEAAHTVKVSLATGTAINALKPVVVVSDKATVSPASGAEVDFSKGAVEYTVTAENGTKQVYVVTVTADGATTPGGDTNTPGGDTNTPGGDTENPGGNVPTNPSIDMPTNTVSGTAIKVTGGGNGLSSDKETEITVTTATGASIAGDKLSIALTADNATVAVDGVDVAVVDHHFEVALEDGKTVYNIVITAHDKKQFKLKITVVVPTA